VVTTNLWWYRGVMDHMAHKKTAPVRSIGIIAMSRDIANAVSTRHQASSTRHRKRKISSRVKQHHQR